MIRQNLDANARHATVALTPSNGVTFLRRTTAGERSYSNATASITTPCWVKLTRAGNTFTVYQSTNGNTWLQIGSVAIRMPTSMYVGLAVTSHDNTALTAVILDRVSVQ